MTAHQPKLIIIAKLFSKKHINQTNQWYWLSNRQKWRATKNNCLASWHNENNKCHQLLRPVPGKIQICGFKMYQRYGMNIQSTPCHLAFLVGVSTGVTHKCQKSCYFNVAVTVFILHLLMCQQKQRQGYSKNTISHIASAKAQLGPSNFFFNLKCATVWLW